MTHDAEDAAAAKRRAQIRQILLARVARTDSGREEAIRDFVGVTRPDLGPDAAGIIADKAPSVPAALTEKWIGLFVDRLFETVPMAQIALLSDGSEDNEAALTLAYVMFLESARMERQMAEDLAAWGAGIDGAAVADDVRRGLALAGEKRRREAAAKAARYQADHRKTN